VPFYNPSALTPRKTPSSIAKDACLLARYLAMSVTILFNLTSYLKRLISFSYVFSLFKIVDLHVKNMMTYIEREAMQVKIFNESVVEAKYWGSQRAGYEEW
jgi:hypothetical protein